MKRGQFSTYFAAIFLLAVMVGAAEILGEKEIIFPEITAIAVGALIAPKQSWNVSPFRLFISVTAMAFCGIGIVNFIALPKILTLPMAFIVGASSLIISKSGFVPQISACVLPVVLGTKSLIYPISVIVMTGIILLIQYLFSRYSDYSYRKFEPIEISSGRVKYFGKQAIIVSLFFFLPAYFGELFFVVPPLIVGYLEICEKGSKAGKSRGKALILIIIASLSGACARLILSEKLGLPLVLAAVISCIIVFIFIGKFRLYFPPCAAICTLPMLLSPEKLWLYPFEVSAGFFIMVLVSFIFNNNKKECKH